MKKLGTAGILAVLAVMLTACGAKTDTEKAANAINTLTLEKDGSVQNIIIESFEQEYYDLDGLNTMIQDSIAEYKKQNPTAEITLVASELMDGQVCVTMKYDSSNSYMGYNNETLFAGTVQEAYSAGYDLDVTLRDVADETVSIGRDELLGMGERHIVIMELPTPQEGQTVNRMRLNCYGNILYMGEGSTLVSKKSVDIEHTQGVSVVVFK